MQPWLAVGTHSTIGVTKLWAGHVFGIVFTLRPRDLLAISRHSPSMMILIAWSIPSRSFSNRGAARQGLLLDSYRFGPSEEITGLAICEFQVEEESRESWLGHDLCLSQFRAYLDWCSYSHRMTHDRPGEGMVRYPQR